MVKYRGPFVLEMPDEAWFDCNMMQKDMVLALDLGRELDVPLPTHRDGQRDPHGRARDGPRPPRLRRDVRRARAALRPAGARTLMAADAAAGARLARPVRADADDPRLRGARQRALHDGEDAGPRPPLQRRGGGRRRRLRGAAARRLHHEHPPRARALPGQGRRHRPHVRRAARPRGRLLPRQGRLDAHRRPAERQPRRQRDRRRQRGHRHRRGAVGADARERAGRGLLLRRGRARPGPALRGHEHGLALEAAGRLRLREQPLQRVHALPRDDRRQRDARAEAFGLPGRHGRRPGRARRPRAPRRRRRARAPRRRARASWSARPTALHGHHVGDVDRAYYRSREEEATWRDERDPIALHGAWLREQGLAERGRSRRRSRRACAARSRRAWRSRSPPRIPTPSEVDQHVYA